MHPRTTSATVASLIAATTHPVDGMGFETLGYYTANDGGGNTYKYDRNSSDTIDGGFVLPGVGGTMSLDASGGFNGVAGTGRFIAVDRTKADVKKFGATGDGATDDTAALQAAINQVTGEEISIQFTDTNVTLQRNAGNLRMPYNFTPNAVQDSITFRYDGGASWQEVSRHNRNTEETITAASAALATIIPSKLDSASNAIAATLGSGDFIGQVKTISMTNASNASTVTVAAHQSGSNTVYSFTTINQALVLLWSGAHWIEVAQ